MEDFLSVILNSFNETLTTAILVLSASMLLYNLTRNLHNRVARTSGALLACVSVVSLADVLVSLRPGSVVLDGVVRLQWIGIAFVPAAMFHLSDALLETTGLPSRGRRKSVARMLYFLSLLFVIAAAFTDLLIIPNIQGFRLVNIVGGSLFPVYVAYFFTAAVVAFVNIQRARQRCLTRDTRRRMGYLQFAMLTPAFGIFPYSILAGISETSTLAMIFLVNLSNLVIVLLLLFLAYPLSFFGSHQPDRAVKSDLLRFMLRGPGTGLLALVVIIFLTPATRILGLPGTTFMPFAVVGTVMFWQWFIALALPRLEKRLIYSGEDGEQIEKLQNLTERLLTRSDLLQLLDAILASACDFLQVNTAFIIDLNHGHAAEVVASIGPSRPKENWLGEQEAALRQQLPAVRTDDTPEILTWHNYWIIPLYSKRLSEEQSNPLIGVFGIQARAATIDLSEDDWLLLRKQIRRAADTLDDMRLQSEIYAALEGLLPQISITRSKAAEVEFLPGRDPSSQSESEPPDRDQFIEQVKVALKQYWGGPGLTNSQLLELQIVKTSLSDNGNHPARTLRGILQEAIDRQKPEGERKLLSPEWMVYNILDLRFIERLKVRDVAIRLALSEPDFYRKQKVAIEAVAQTLLDMDQKARQVGS